MIGANLHRPVSPEEWAIAVHLPPHPKLLVMLRVFGGAGLSEQFHSGLGPKAYAKACAYLDEWGFEERYRVAHARYNNDDSNAEYAARAKAEREAKKALKRGQP